MKILISGGGIAGLTLAYWLYHYGHEPVVIEQANGLRRDGYGIDFYSTGYDVAERMGIIERLRARQIKAHYLAYVDEAGTPVARISLDTLRREAFNGTYMALMHATLEEELYTAVRFDVDIRFNTSIQHIDQTSDTVTATFDNGTQESYDFLVGADGIHSNVRSLVCGPEQDFAHYLGYYTAACIVPAHYGPIDGWQNYAEPGRQIGVYPTDTPGDLATLFIFSAPDDGYVPHSQRLAKLQDVYQGMGWITPQVLADMNDQQNIFMDTVTQIHMPYWSAHRVVLLGDACGCMTLVSGQGVSMAMGGAYILAEELRDQRDMHRAFLNYEHRMRPEVEKRQHKAHDFAKSFVPGSELGLKAGRLIMNILFRDAFAGVLKGQLFGTSILRDRCLRRLPESSGNIIGYAVAGTLTDVDYATSTLDIEHELTQANAVRLLLEMDDFAGIDLKALWADLRFGVEHGRHVEKLAVVGDERWAGWLATLSWPFYARHARHFPTAAIDQAWEWLCEAG